MRSARASTGSVSESWEVVCEERETERETKKKGKGRAGRRGGEVRNPQPEMVDS